VNTPGAGLTEEKGFDLYIAGTVHLVSDDFDQQTIEEKWDRALAAAQPVSIPAPKRRPGPVQKAKSATEDELKSLYRDGVLITQLVAEHIAERWNIQIDDTGSLWFYDSTHSIFRPLNTSDDTAGGARADIARILLNDNSFSGGRVNTLIDAIHATRHLLPKIDMDKSARYIPFRNGVLDRETREFLQHSPTCQG